jgi:hypothetical protein
MPRFVNGASSGAENRIHFAEKCPGNSARSMSFLGSTGSLGQFHFDIEVRPISGKQFSHVIDPTDDIVRQELVRATP